jgi:glutathione S-transferase
MNRSGYIREICEYLDSQLNPRYILSSRITIADFLFLETCNYTLGLFDSVDKYQLEAGK